MPIKFPALFLLAAAAAFSQTPAVQVSSYLFQNTLDAQRPGSPALTAVDPLGRNNFRRDVVLGQERFVYETGGTAPPLASQAGLTYRAAGLPPAKTTPSKFSLPSSVPKTSGVASTPPITAPPPPASISTPPAGSTTTPASTPSININPSATAPIPTL